MTLEQFILQCGMIRNKHDITLEKLYNEGYKSWISDFLNDKPKEARVAALKEMGLDAEDAFFIWAYTGSCSSWLNSDKRNCN